MKTLISISRGTWKYPFTAEGPDEDQSPLKFQQRDLMKTFISSSAEGPEKTAISISRGT
jgi:hypothetical protein